MNVNLVIKENTERFFLQKSKVLNEMCGIQIRLELLLPRFRSLTIFDGSGDTQTE